ncbi:MAG: phosphate-starvation-inducible PsiE family protein [Gammaproteobacteria bacterium]|jgi:phosphate starvation-inducible membrane PsiE|nr:phosphate-starvation-inducible PsiE family protein [Gammaproteobacteria bacterium]
MPHPLVHRVEKIGDVLTDGFHLVGLFVVGASILWASWAEVFKIIGHGGPDIKDILLLFIYLELGAMVGIYFKTKQLPVRYLIYIAITALTRLLAIDIKTMTEERLIAVTGAILLLALAVLLLRVGSSRYPSRRVGERDSAETDAEATG